MAGIVKTFAEAVRHLFEKSPQLSPKQAAFQVCRRNDLPTEGPEFKKKVNIAKVVKNRLKHSVNVNRSNSAPAKMGVVNWSSGPVLQNDLHRLVYGPRVLPAGVLEAIRACAADSGNKCGWSRVGKGRLANGMLRCRIQNTRYVMIVYPSTGTLTVYAGRKKPDFSDLSCNVCVALGLVLLECSPDRADEGRMKQHGHELDEFLDSLWARPGSFDFAVGPIEGLEKVGPFEIKFKDLVDAGKDGSHPRHIEFRFKQPQISQDQINRVLKETCEAVKQMQQQSEALNAVAKEQGAAMSEFNAHLRQLAEAQGELAEALRQLSPGGRSGAVSGRSRSQGEDRRWS